MPKEDQARLVLLLSELNKVLRPPRNRRASPRRRGLGGRTSGRLNAPFGMSVRTQTDRWLRRENDTTMSSRIYPAAVAARGAVDGSAPDDRRRALSAMLFAGRAVTELILLGSLFTLYRYGRLLATGHEATARAHAQWVHQAERLVHLPSEAGVQAAVQAAAGSTKLFEAANTYYVAVHFPLVIAFLTWGFLVRERHEYLWARNLLIMQTGLALGIHIAFPLAPPRMFPSWGFSDTAATYGPSAYAGSAAHVANQYAAMPSLHIGWAALIAVVVARTGPRWLGVLATGHALLTTAVVIVTANHWWTDGLVSVALLTMALVLFPSPGSSRIAFAHWRPQHSITQVDTSVRPAGRMRLPTTLRSAALPTVDGESLEPGATAEQQMIALAARGPGRPEGRPHSGPVHGIRGSSDE